MNASRILHSPDGASIEIMRWKVRTGSKVAAGTVLLHFKRNGDAEMHKLRSECVGTVSKIFQQVGQKVAPRQNLLQLDEGCSHPIVMKDMCAQCGKDLREDANPTESIPVTTTPEPKRVFKRAQRANISMVHSVPELMVSGQHAEEIGRRDIERLRARKKLVLLVDLDQTLIHTTTDNVPNKLKGVKHFPIAGVWYHTMFRPGTQEFLDKIVKYYELHIVTYGVRIYAHTIAAMLDDNGKHFSHRILSRDELIDINTKKANLRSLFPCGDDMVAIIDDREDVWNYSPNIIPVLPYKFFAGTGDINAPNKVLKPTAAIQDKLTAGDVTLEEDGDKVDNDKCVQKPETVQVKGNGDTNVQDNSENASHTEQPSDLSHADNGKDSASKEQCAIESSDNTIKQSENTEESTELSKTTTQNGTTGEKNTDTIESGEDKSRAGKDSKEESDRLVEEEEVVWPDDDSYLQNLEKILINLHKEFYTQPADQQISVSQIIKKHRVEVLEGCTLAFSGLFPQSIFLRESTAYEIAVKLGAEISETVSDKVTHLVTSRLGTRKVRQASQLDDCTIVHPDWLWLSWYKMHREKEIKHLLTAENEVPEPLKHSAGPMMCGKYDPSFGRKRKPMATNRAVTGKRSAEFDKDSEASSSALTEETEKSPEKKQRFSDSFNPLMSIDSDDFNDMENEVDGELSLSSSDSDETGQSASHNAKLRRKVCSSNENTSSESSSSESLSNDYPKGWGPAKLRLGPGGTTPPDEHLTEQHEEVYIAIQDRLELGMPMEYNSDQSSDLDDEAAAALDEAMFGAD